MSNEQKETTEEFIFTPDNLIENIHRLGPWSCYELARWAFEHYFHIEYDADEQEQPDSIREEEMVKDLNCKNWNEVIRKFHAEVGYKPTGGKFNPKIVNNQ